MLAASRPSRSGPPDSSRALHPAGGLIGRTCRGRSPVPGADGEEVNMGVAWGLEGESLLSEPAHHGERRTPF